MDVDSVAKCEPDRMWERTLAELRPTMARGTFEARLAGSRGIGYENGRFLVAVNSQLSVDWLQARMLQQVQQMFVAVAGVDVPVSFVAMDADVAPPAPPAAATQLRLPGFPDISQNWTKTPDFYFDVVLPGASPSCAVVVGAVIRHTLGRRDKIGNSAQWWCGVTHRVWRKKTGIKNKTAVLQGVWDARAAGWIKRRVAGRSFDYGLRWHDEAVDFPLEERPLMRRKPCR